MMTEGMTAMKSALEIVQGIKSLSTINDDADAPLELSNLRMSLAKADTAMADVMQKNASLHNEVAALKKQLAVQNAQPILPMDSPLQI